MASPFEISYGQNGEDVVLHRALADVPTGFYVEIGANDPTELSISRAFYDAGWSGVEVEPIESLAVEFARQRPRDQVVQAAVTAAPVAEVNLHLIPGTGLSTLDSDISRRHAESGFAPIEVSVPAKSLDAILDEAAPPTDIHFMVIDTEGTEGDVLASIDLTRWRPWILVIEATLPLSNTPSEAKWEAPLLAAGYQFCLFDGISRFYVADEHAQRLRPALSYPANVLDGFVPRHWHEREKLLRETQEKLAELERQHRQTQAELVRWRGEVLDRWSRAITSSPAPPAGRELVMLRSEIEALRATVSWRLTAPLRAVQTRRLEGRR